jgi:stage II sporulation protein D
MRRLLLFLLISLFSFIPFISLDVAPFAAQATGAPATFTIKGSGFGHGVGLSQFGAKGQALEGKSAVEILNYYFPTSQVIPVSDTQTIRVNIAHQVSTIKISVMKNKLSNQWTLSAGETGTISTGTNPISFAILGKQISAGNLGIADYWTLRWNESTTTMVVPTESSTSTLAHGYLQLKPVFAPGLGYRIEVTNTLNLRDHYLWGIGEMSSSWPSAALQAQAIASRTFALNRLRSVRKECDCNIYNHKYDQVFVGYSKESEPRYGELWKKAVLSTNVDSVTALAITYQGKPISAFFSSSTGGMTATSKDVWGTDYPYLVSVPDPWSLDKKLNPKYSAWTVTVTQAQIARAFGLPDVMSYIVTSRTKTSAVLTVTATSSMGVKSKLAVSDFKVRLKIPSSWFALPATALIPATVSSNSSAIPN